MNQQVQRPPTSQPLIILFIIIIVLIITGGIVYYTALKADLLSETVQELSSISDLKIKQITQWRFERLADAKFFSENILTDNITGGLLDDPAVADTGGKARKFLQSLTEYYDYSSAMLLNRNGEVVMAMPPGTSAQSGRIQSVLKDLGPDRKIVMTDIDMSGSPDSSFLDLVVPLSGKDLADSVTAGYLVMCIDPAKGLHPLISSWPADSKTAETLIVRKEGDHIIYLSRLRHSQNYSTVLRKPASDERLPAAMAFRGIKSTTDGIDYRGVRVVASIKKIPGTTWYMVSKKDRSEIITLLNAKFRGVMMVMLLFVLTVGLFLGFLLWNQRVLFYREKYEDELGRLALFKHFDYILKFANDIILLLDRDLLIAEANDRACEVYMIQRDILLGKSMEDLQAPGTIEGMRDQIARAVLEGSATFETIHMRKDGNTFPVEISTRMVYIEGTGYYQIIGRDITERKIAEESLRESELRFRKIFEESPFPMVIAGKDFGILMANASFCNMTGYSVEELKSMPLGDLTYPEDAGDDALNLMRLIAEDIPVYHNEKRYLKKDGTVILGSSTISVVRNNLDEAQIFICMIEDITQKKKAEQDLIAAKLRAEESDRLKTAFLHNVSHEIRTPMNAIIGFSSLLNEPDVLDHERQQYTDIISQSSNQLLSIINDIVDVANIESGQVKVRISRTDLNHTLRSLLDQYSMGVKQHRIPISLSAGLPDQQAIISTDNTKLIQIISNLINNAIKFTRDGRIEFGYTLKDTNLEFFVNDTGIGIPPESLGKVFDRFYQVDRTVSRQFGGTGLGLSICKAYVELLGGTISVSSDPGNGTSFTFRIPYIPSE